MRTVRSHDGTTVALDRTGAGPPLVIVGGAFSYRRWKGFLRLAELLAPRFTVIGYDRRGRGDSGDTAPYAIEREIEDLDAVIEDTGGPARVFGMSSGGVLALRAAASGTSIERLAVYQPPFVVDHSGHVPPADLGIRLAELAQAGRRGAAVRLFMTQGMGAPAAVVGLMQLVAPLWSRLAALAHTLPYDHAVMGETLAGDPLAPEPWGSVTAPTLVIDGGRSPASARHAADALAAILPDGRRRTLPRQGHNVSMDLTAAALEEFFNEASEQADPAGRSLRELRR